MNITSAIPTPNLAAEGTNYWQSVSQSIANAIDSALPYVWVLVSLAIIGVGLLCIIGSDRSKEVAKSKFVYICIGAALVLAAAYIGKGITSALNGDILAVQRCGGNIQPHFLTCRRDLQRQCSALFAGLDGLYLDTDRDLRSLSRL